MGKASRDKGKRGELEVVHAWRSVFPNCERTAGQQALRSDKAPDVSTGTGYFWIESKLTKQVSIPAALKQAKEALGEDPTRWVVARTRRTHAKGEPAICSMYESDFLELLDEWWNLKNL